MPKPGTISLPFGTIVCVLFGSFDGVVEACDVVAVVELVLLVVVLLDVVALLVVVSTNGVFAPTLRFCCMSTGGATDVVALICLLMVEFGFVGLMGEIGEVGLFIFVAVITHVFEVVTQSDQVGMEYGSEQVDDLFCVILPVYPA